MYKINATFSGSVYLLKHGPGETHTALFELPPDLILRSGCINLEIHIVNSIKQKKGKSPHLRIV